MKPNQLRRLLFLLVGSAVLQLSAQQGEAEPKQLVDLRAKAEQGDVQAEYELGRALFRGDLGLATNHVEAVKWLRKAAEQNNPKAQYGMGCCYANGGGVATNHTEAVKWFL